MNPPRGKVSKISKTTTSSSSSGVAMRSAKPETINMELEEEDEDHGVVGSRGGEQATTTIPIEERPLLWFEDPVIAIIKQFHKHLTQMMRGKLSNFPLQVGDMVRSFHDTSIQHSWPRDEVPHRAMEQDLDMFNTMYYLSQIYMTQRLANNGLKKEKRKLTERVTTSNNFRLALEKRATSLEVNVTQLSNLTMTLTNEYDQSRNEVRILKEQLEKEVVMSKLQAEVAAQREIDSMKETISSLRLLCNEDRNALATAE